MSARFFAVYDLQSGKVIRTGSVTPHPQIDLVAAQAMPGEGAIETEVMLDPHKIAFDFLSGTLVPIRDTRLD
jgi:hypothetical protein